MAVKLLTIILLCVSLLGAVAVPAPEPGRIPKVYNALISSNQNLEPSKAYPIYQPILHDAFALPLHPSIFYGGEIPINNGIQPPIYLPSEPQPSQPIPTLAPENPTTPAPDSPPAEESTTVAAATETSSPEVESGKTTPAPPLPPNTQSPIPLNHFGLPPQILPLAHFDPSYKSFTQVGPFAYPYPGVRYYDPYEPFTLNRYPLPPIYRPFTNFLEPSIPLVVKPPVAEPSAAPPSELSGSTPPPEPTDLNVLNYSSKDPAIPNVPPPLLPQGGLKSDKSE